MTLDETVKQMQDTLIVMSEIQARRASVQKTQAEELDNLRKMLHDGFALHEQRMKEHDQKMRDLDARIGRLVSGIGELLRKP